jgi:hypothetical protein
VTPARDDDDTDPSIGGIGLDTPDNDPTTLPGYEIGFRRGWSLSRSHGLEQLRQCLVAGGTAPQAAAELQRRFAEWLRAHGG